MYLIVGGTSFIGVYVVDELLSHNCKIAVTGRNNKLKKLFSIKRSSILQFGFN